MSDRPALEHVKVTVNGELFERDVEPRLHLGDFLRHELKLTGTHIGCEHGVCGACTVIFNDVPVRSCLMFADRPMVRASPRLKALPEPTGHCIPFRKHSGIGMHCNAVSARPE